MYTAADLDAQLAHAREMMVKSGCPGVRLTRTCAEDNALAHQIEDQDPFQAAADGYYIGESGFWTRGFCGCMGSSCRCR